MSVGTRTRKTITVTELFGPKVLRVAPDGYHTVKEVAEAHGIDASTARRKMQAAGLDSVIVLSGSTRTAAYRVDLA